MKKTFMRGLAAFLLAAGLSASPALAADMQITVNGSALSSDVAPLVINNRTMLPLRACAEALAATVNYDPSGRIDIYRGNDKIVLLLDTPAAWLNGEKRPLDVEPQVVESRTLVPLRFIGEAFDCAVNWQSENNTVSIVAAGGSGQQTTDTPTPAPMPDPAMTPETVPDAATIANQALQQLNSVRLQKHLDALITAAELGTMADAHSKDMAEDGYFGSNSPTAGTLSSRAKALKLPQPTEIIAKIDYRTETVYQAVTKWLTDEDTRTALLDAAAGYIGIGAYQQPDTTYVYLTAEVMPSRAYFTELPASSTVTAPKLAVRGRSQRLTENVIVYRLADGNAQMYSERKAYAAKGDGTYFYTEVEFDDPGTYALQVGNCLVKVTYKPTEIKENGH